MKKFVPVLALAAAVLAPTAALSAEYGYGTVKSVSKNEVTVTEYDYDKDEDVDIVYDAGSAKLENFKSLAEIRPGDGLDLIYLTRDGKRVVTNAELDKRNLQHTPS